ncbi:MAG: quinone-dependent dihydroorotate dehydrogenase [Candidatus Puniceispirillaceae bacterium]
MWDLLANLVRHLPAEAAHRVAVAAMHYHLGPRPDQRQSKADLAVRFAGLEFANPLGLAAGFDKNAICFNGAMGLGFSHVEVGTITPKPQPGNPRPRVFRLPEEKAVINRYGFNSHGMGAVAENLYATASKRTGILGVNVGANKTSNDPIDDYRKAVALLAPYADYITLNISSPNTPGLRNLQTKRHLADLLMAGFAGCREAGFDPACGSSKLRKKPIFLKISPDLRHHDLATIVESCVEAGVSGIIATNTTIGRPAGLNGVHAGEAGGLSGEPLFSDSTGILAEVASLSQNRLGLIGVGGVSTGWQAYAKILVGADMLQLYTGLALEGLHLPSRILQELSQMLDADGAIRLDQIKGQIVDPATAIKHAVGLYQGLSK